MAENKKKKVNWKDALAAKKTTDEVVEVEIDGNIVPIVRNGPGGRIPDDKWEKIKKRAVKKIPVEITYDDEKPKAEAKGPQASGTDKSLDWPLIRRLSKDLRQVADTVISPDQKALVEKMDDDARADYLREQFRRKGYRVPDSTSAEDRLRSDAQDESPKKSEAGGVLGQALKFIKGATPSQPLTKEQADQKYAEEYEASEYVVPREAKEVAGAVSKGAAAVGDVAGRVGSGLATAGSELAAAPSKVSEGLAKAGSELAAVPGKVVDSPAGDFVRNVSQTAGDIGKGLLGVAPATNVAGVVNAKPQADGPMFVHQGEGNSILPFLTPQDAPNDQQMAARIDLGLDPLTAEPPVTPPLLPQGQVSPPAQSGSGSASASMSVTPSVASPKVGVVGSSDNFSKSIGEVEANNERIAKANADFVAASDKALADKQAMRLKYAQDAEEANKLAIQAKLTAVEEAQKLQARRQMVLEKVREAASTPIDPNRYWNNKSDGQKAMAVIAGALFGFTGQGMNWLQRLDGLVENDNRLQAADRASQVQGLQAEAAGLGELARDAIANGASLAEARLLEKQGKYEGLMMNLQNMADKTENAQVKVKAAEAVGLLSERVAGLRAQQDQLSLARAAQINQSRFRQAELDLEARKFNLSMQAKAAEAGGKGLEQVRGPQAVELGALAAAERMAADLQKQFGQSSVPARALDKVAAWIPRSDAAKYNVNVDQAINWIATIAGAGVLQKHDLERWDALMAKAGDLNGEQKLKILVDDIRANYNLKLDSLKRAGFDVGNYAPLGGATRSTEREVEE